jgi:quercetin dioxygenase-like cupin family protein
MSQQPSYAIKQITPTLPKGDQLEVRVRPVTLEPGWVGPWHTHPTPPVIYVIEGTVSVEEKGKGIVDYKAGEAVIEPINTVMRAMNKGQTPVKMVIFQVSPPDLPDTQSAQSQ